MKDEQILEAISSIMTLAQVAEDLGVSRAIAKEIVDNEHFKEFKIGVGHYYNRQALEDYKNKPKAHAIAVVTDHSEDDVITLLDYIKATGDYDMNFFDKHTDAQVIEDRCPGSFGADDQFEEAELDCKGYSATVCARCWKQRKTVGAWNRITGMKYPVQTTILEYALKNSVTLRKEVAGGRTVVEIIRAECPEYYVDGDAKVSELSTKFCDGHVDDCKACWSQKITE